MDEKLIKSCTAFVIDIEFKEIHKIPSILIASKSKKVCLPISAQRVGFFNVVSGQVLKKIPGSGSALGTRWALAARHLEET